MGEAINIGSVDSIDEGEAMVIPAEDNGTKDDIAGSGEELAALMPHAKAIDIPGRDHMLAVGDRVFKAAVLEFYREIDAES